MILTIVLSAITFLIIYSILISQDIVWPPDWSDVGNLVVYFFFSVLLSGVISLFTILICRTISDKHLADEEYYEYQVEDIEIYSLRTSNDLNGTFVLGTGNVSTKTKYYMVIKTNIGYQIKDIDASVAYILYTKDQPHLEIYSHKDYKCSKARWFTTGATTYYKIYVPKGSIIENYEIK